MLLLQFDHFLTIQINWLTGSLLKLANRSLIKISLDHKSVIILSLT